MPWVGRRQALMILAMAWVASVTMSRALFWSRGGCVGDAVADVFVEADRDVLQRAVDWAIDCGDLLHHVDAVDVLLDRSPRRGVPGRRGLLRRRRRGGLNQR